MVDRRVRERQKHVLELLGGSKNMINRLCRCLEAMTPPKLHSWMGCVQNV